MIAIRRYCTEIIQVWQNTKSQYFAICGRCVATQTLWHVSIDRATCVASDCKLAKIIRATGAEWLAEMSTFEVRLDDAIKGCCRPNQTLTMVSLDRASDSTSEKCKLQKVKIALWKVTEHRMAKCQRPKRVPWVCIEWQDFLRKSWNL